MGTPQGPSLRGNADGSRRGRRCGCVLWGSNGDAGKQQQKPTSSLLQGGTPKTRAKLSISCEQGLCKAARDAPGFWKIEGNVTTLVLTEAGEREPRQEGSPVSQA